MVRAAISENKKGFQCQKKACHSSWVNNFIHTPAGGIATFLSDYFQIFKIQGGGGGGGGGSLAYSG